MPKIIIASGPVIVEDGKVLLNQHGDDKFWKFCGGKVDDYELNLIETAKREFQEEMGAEMAVRRSAPFFYFATKKNVDIILVHFLAVRLGRIKPGKEITKWKWAGLDKLGTMNLAPNIIPTLKHFGFLKE